MRKGGGPMGNKVDFVTVESLDRQTQQLTQVELQLLDELPARDDGQ
ncbi:hypothetical protein GCM10009733_024710 [Nonomuraea maheshkhaliensis]|uniref:Uncharacterized protein n=1 Tax=Nonomuraea maheshkhaliensis TaxID=419590 RepID=A0ABN2F3Z1_9ACTN